MAGALNGNDFFHEATIRICGSLEIEESLFNCCSYIRNFIPVEDAYLAYYERDLSALRLYAMANEESGRRIDLHVSLPPEVRAYVEKKGEPEISMVNEVGDHPVLGQISKALAEPEFSALIMHLNLGNAKVGTVAFAARGKNRYSPDHLRLFAMLKEPFAIALSNSRRYQEVLDLQELLADDNRYLKDELRRAAGEEIIGADFGLKGVMEMVRQVAPLASQVLLLGETGTGKEVIANAIHSFSPRSEGPFIKVNCGAIPENLVDSELFGHEKGAFTGALSLKRGRFERANGGTIFLDEVGELSSEVQVRLLRVLQEKEIERVGGTEPVKIDIRVIAATHRSLERMVADGRFREDLYYRLRVFPIAIPALRERKADIPALVHHFMRKKAREMCLPGIPVLAPGAMDLLMASPWPGNIRELENGVERALILARGKPLTFDELASASGRNEPATLNTAKEEVLSLDEAMSCYIRKVLELTGGRVGGEGGAARLLGIKPGTLRHRMTRLGIPFGRKASG